MCWSIGFLFIDLIDKIIVLTIATVLLFRFCLDCCCLDWKHFGFRLPASQLFSNSFQSQKFRLKFVDYAAVAILKGGKILKSLNSVESIGSTNLVVVTICQIELLEWLLDGTAASITLLKKMLLFRNFHFSKFLKSVWLSQWCGWTIVHHCVRDHNLLWQFHRSYLSFWLRTNCRFIG